MERTYQQEIKHGVKKVWFDAQYIYVELENKQILREDINFSSRLKNASLEQKNSYTISAFGIHWAEIDEDLNFQFFTPISL